jgi:hypothetical protein
MTGREPETAYVVADVDGGEQVTGPGTAAQEIVRSISFIPRSQINQQTEASSDRPLDAVTTG